MTPVFCIDSEHHQEYPTIVADGNRALCYSCEEWYRRTVRLLVYDYIDLSQLIGRRARLPEEHLSRPKAASTPPIDLFVEAVRRDIAFTLSIWEPHVREEARLPQRATLSMREGYSVALAVRTIAPRVDLLASIDAVFARHAGAEAEPSVRDGIEGLRRLSTLHSLVRKITGVTKAAFSLPGDCPECHVPALHRYDGEDRVICGACHRSWPYTEYQRWVRLVVTEFLEQSPVTDGPPPR